MPQPPFDAAAYLDVAAAAQGLGVPPRYREGVTANLQRIAQLAARVLEFPLPEEEEPAPVYRP